MDPRMSQKTKNPTMMAQSSPANCIDASLQRVTIRVCVEVAKFGRLCFSITRSCATRGAHDDQRPNVPHASVNDCPAQGPGLKDLEIERQLAMKCHLDLAPLCGAIQEIVDFAKAAVSVNPNLHGTRPSFLSHVCGGGVPLLETSARGSAKASVLHSEIAPRG
jgi:hypothetical protein